MSEAHSVPQRVEFQHKFFLSVDDALFRMSEQEDEAVLVFKITGEDQEIVLSLEGIKREFKLESTSDGQMLDTIKDALKFIKFMRIGDAFPSEITTNQASWNPQRQHVEEAHNRLTAQLVTWIGGNEKTIGSPQELEDMLSNKETQNKINQAFGMATESLGKKDANPEQAFKLLENLTGEMAYIEALREKLGAIINMKETVEKLRDCYTLDNNNLENFAAVLRLLTTAINDYSRIFNEFDARTGEVASLMRNINHHSDYIRKTRDELHCRLQAWDDILSRWDTISLRRGKKNEALLRDTYAFLAPRFMAEDEWILLSRQAEAKLEDLDTRMDW